MMSEEDRFVVIGAGHAGGRAVEAMRGAGFRGSIALVGAERHLPMERPPLSKRYLEQPEAGNAPPIRPREWYQDNNVRLLFANAATAVDAAARRVVLANGETLGYTRLLLAMGGRVRRLPVPGASLANIHTLRSIDDADRIAAGLAKGARLVIVGGGFIGLEAAAVASGRGARVIVLEATERLMSRTALSEVSAIVRARHEKAGVGVRLRQSVAAFEGQGSVSGVVLADGEVIACDLVIIGVGIYPDTALAEAAGLAVDNGIVVDEYARTSHPDIYAAGDVTNHFNPMLGRRVRQESWQNAQNQAISAARNMCGHEQAHADIPWSWSEQFDLITECAGTPQRWARLVTRGDPALPAVTYFQLSEEGIVVGVQSVNGGREMKAARRLIGCAPPASALVDISVRLRSLQT